MWSIIAIAVFVAYAALAISALVGVSRANLPTTASAVWILIIIVAPFLGSLCWFFIRPDGQPTS